MAPLFLLTPATLIWSAPFSVYGAQLGLRTAFTRAKLLADYNDEKPSAKGDNAPAGKVELDEKLDLYRSIHMNFSEHVPLAITLIALAEMNGAPLSVIHTLYGTLFAFRVAHAKFGLEQPKRSGKGRPLGALGTYAIIIGAGLLNLSLSWDYLLASLNIK